MHRSILAALLALSASACAAPLAAVIAHDELLRICPLPAAYNAFHELERTRCASDAQWATALAEEAHEQAVEDRVDCLRSGACPLELEPVASAR